MPARDDKDTAGVQANGADAAEPLVDRVLELDLFREHIRQIMADGPGRMVLMMGESGVGKSRLAAEAMSEARELGMKTASVDCLGRGAEPLLPFKEGLAAFAGRSPDRLRRMLAGSAPHLLDMVPFVGTFLAKIGERLAEAHDDSATMQGVYEQLARTLIKLSENGGLFLLVEDLHAADSDSLHFLNYLSRKISNHRILVSVTIQEEQLDGFPELRDMVAQWTATGYATLTVVPLERAHVGEYVQRIAAQGRPADEAMVDRLFRLTGGNPFFLREALSLLAQESGPRPPTEIIPPRTDAILRRRLARADTDTIRFLRAASVVLETTQQLEPITYVLECTQGEAVDALNAACALRLMRESPDGSISFVHSLMQRAVYAGMGTNQRRYLHRRTAEWSERHNMLASAAFHFEHAGQTQEMVRTAMRAATQAEHAGMYHTALMLYQKVRPFMAIEELGPLLGRALIVLGDWDQAEQLAERLPIDDARVRLLRSELRFVRGDFEGAKDEAEMALMSQSADRIQVLIRLADIGLYLGDFGSAQRYSHSALQVASESGSANLRARCLGMIAATEFFGGDIDTARGRFLEALKILEDTQPEDRDRTLHTTILGNLGNVAEATKEWPLAEQYHRRALRQRQEIADARGVLHSLHALGRSRIGQQDRTGGLAHITDAEELATDLNETLERAKIWHTRAELHLTDGDYEAALDLASRALNSFAKSRTQYDVTHVRLTLSAASLAYGHSRNAADHGAAARSSIEAMGYGLLQRLYPETAYSRAERIAGALTAYACGDAFGLPWEGKRPTAIQDEQIELLPTRQGWPRGATSDDTALTLLAAQHLAERDGNGDAHAFLTELTEHSPPIQGLGPTTSAAIEHFRETGELPAAGAATNGAVMRALPVGWVIPYGHDDQRRQLAIEMSRATHTAPSAQVAACVIAACASWALEGAPPDLLLEIATEEAHEAARTVGTGTGLAELLTDLSRDAWPAPNEGISLDPYETITAVMSCLASASSLRKALIDAVRLGGDTDTVASLVGGLLGCRLSPQQVRAELPWHRIVLLAELDNHIPDVSASLATIRAVLSG
jgi:ADP-ribosylglycohydrolase/tetratricopeptide (TPR) repeat protein